jgi:hypothetical protein
VGNGLATLDRWTVFPRVDLGMVDHEDIDAYRRLSRDLYVPAGDHGFWQGALRDPADPLFSAIRSAVTEARSISLELLYGDHEGGQRTVTRFAFIPAHDGVWLASASRYWYLDHSNPR